MTGLRVPQSMIDSLLDSTDLVSLIGASVRLDRLPNGLHIGVCPFHQGDDKSLCVDDIAKRFACTNEACNFSGSAIGWQMYYNGQSFTDSIADLARSINLDVSKWIDEGQLQDTFDKRSKLLDSVAAHYHHKLIDSPSALEYLKQRGISMKTVIEFQIGLADNDDGQELIAKFGSIRVSQSLFNSFAPVRQWLTSPSWCDWHGSQLAGESPAFAL